MAGHRPGERSSGSGRVASRYRHRAGRTIETAPDHVTLRAVTQIAPGGLWVTATVQWIRPNFPGYAASRALDCRRSVAEECRASPAGGHTGPLLTCCRERYRGGVGMHGDGEDDIAEHDGGPLRMPGWARRPRWLSAGGWRPSRGAAVLGAAGLIVGLCAGYALGYGRLARDGRPPGMTVGHAGPSAGPASPAPSGSPTQPRGFGAYAPAQGIAGFAGTVIDQTAGACSMQHGRELQLGIEVINLSGTTVTLGQVKPILPMGGLRALSQQWSPCDAISPSWLIAGGDGTVTIIRAAGQSGAPGMPPGATRLGDALQGEDVVPAGGTAWFSVIFQVLVSCPRPLPVQFSVSYRGDTRQGTARLQGFPDLGKVSYTGCAGS
jgi:hypothetical protein